MKNDNTILLQIDGLSVEVCRKPIRRMHLRILPTEGNIRLSLPWQVPLTEGEAFVRKNTDWILRTRQRICAEAQQRTVHYQMGEQLPLFGKPYLLQVEYINVGNSVRLYDNHILLKCSAQSTEESRKAIVDNFRRKQLAVVLEQLVETWLQQVGESPVAWSIRTMKTEWGSCTPARRTMRFNLELAKYPIPLIEYVVVHEITHLRIANHSADFWQLMSERIPDWKTRRKQLNDKQIIREN
ncbi:MAG: M48 family metallopeptidase [Paludibacter sp.]|nr:M48 family metallopeptidase [Bacteroidales bacterium]MCM1069477.1 M48 family metallopeptidase [Prevotella sp.]MCM1354133.1 M48 family metallopeptidase [Bacteroides sp.]MCM1443010.1 M48 family metallopeptidase [Muribaculum sp.]MCM1482208.1 M48 family metallopeptidase [Paludibacter sp.]